MTAVKQLQNLMEGVCDNQMKAAMESAIWILAVVIDEQQAQISELKEKINNKGENYVIRNENSNPHSVN